MKTKVIIGILGGTAIALTIMLLKSKKEIKRLNGLLVPLATSANQSVKLSDLTPGTPLGQGTGN